MNDTAQEHRMVEARETKEKYEHLVGFLKGDLKFGKAPANMTDGELADLIVYLRDLKSLVEGREKLLGEALKNRHSEDLEAVQRAYLATGVLDTFTIQGEATPGLTYSFVVQQRIDMEAIEAEMGSEWVEEHKKPTTFFQARKAKW